MMTRAQLSACVLKKKLYFLFRELPFDSVGLEEFVFLKFLFYFCLKSFLLTLIYLICSVIVLCFSIDLYNEEKDLFAL